MSNQNAYPGITPGSGGVILLGLGPGDPGLITREAWQILENSTEVWLRTRQHPGMDELPGHLKIFSFDDLYEQGEDFASIYASIVQKVIQLAGQPDGVVYAVPGHPLVAEATVPEIIRQARDRGLPHRIVEGMSFLEPVITALEIDPLPQTVLVDALDLLKAHVPPFPPSMPAIVAQIYSASVAAELKITLTSVYPDEHPVKLIHAAGTALQEVEAISLYQIDQSRKTGLATVLYLPPLDRETSFEAFQEVIAHLRSPEGCPWDREQTHLSLRPYLLEETYEVLQALDAEDVRAMEEEFGDLLLQVVLHAQIASESGDFTIHDVLRTVNNKIVRRHPHVFADIDIKDTKSVLVNWERLKAQERKGKGEKDRSLLDGIALALPALVQAGEYQSRAARVGFAWPNVQDVINKIFEEVEEIRTSTQDEREAEIGDLFFALVNLARWYHIDAESALRQANQRFRKRFAHLEAVAREQNKPLEQYSLEEKLELWRDSKQT
jgi:tetrapyrrole methylase family protein/MazG family protein